MNKWSLNSNLKLVLTSIADNLGQSLARQVYNLFQYLWNWFIIENLVELKEKISLQSRGLRSRARCERDETRLELISRIGGTGTRLLFSGLVTRENSGKIREIK